jgi:hypothetical protein
MGFRASPKISDDYEYNFGCPVQIQWQEKIGDARELCGQTEPTKLPLLVYATRGKMSQGTRGTGLLSSTDTGFL